MKVVNANNSALHWLIAVLVAVSGCSTDHDPKQFIILDTDIATDYDDAGAVAMLHGLAKRRECRILATIASTNNEKVPKVLAILNSYFGDSSIPVGKAHAGAPQMMAANGWVDSVCVRFGDWLGAEEPHFEGAVSLYRKTLAQSPDTSVTILSIGFLSNLAALLASEGDTYSDLNGVQLIRTKVAKLVMMGGAFPEGREYNIQEDADAALQVFEHWPTKIICSGYEIGSKIFTGSRFSMVPDDENPVNWVYRYNFAARNEEVRESWDQATVLMAVTDPDRYFYVHGPGQVTVSQDGFNSWNPENDARHFFVSPKYPYPVIEKRIEKLMIDPTKN
ncbi:MAG TPA: nucleoside hydrolase [Parapedobacter sp.]|nr:nucleoside hydrolase [Parapedobacter sp.]